MSRYFFKSKPSCLAMTSMTGCCTSHLRSKLSKRPVSDVDDERRPRRVREATWPQDPQWQPGIHRRGHPPPRACERWQIGARYQIQGALSASLQRAAYLNFSRPSLLSPSHVARSEYFDIARGMVMRCEESCKQQKFGERG